MVDVQRNQMESAKPAPPGRRMQTFKREQNSQNLKFQSRVSPVSRAWDSWDVTNMDPCRSEVWVFQLFAAIRTVEEDLDPEVESITWSTWSYVSRGMSLPFLYHSRPMSASRSMIVFQSRAWWKKIGFMPELPSIAEFHRIPPLYHWYQTFADYVTRRLIFRIALRIAFF